MKTCNTCKKEKEINEFPHQKKYGSRKGHYTYVLNRCRKCQKEISLRNQVDNSERFKKDNIVVFATKKDPSRIKYITRYVSHGHRNSNFAIKSNLNSIRCYWYDIDSKNIVYKAINFHSKQLLTKNETPESVIDEFLEFEKQLKLSQEAEYKEVLKTLTNIYENETRNVSIFSCDGELTVIKNGNGQKPIMAVSRVVKNMLDERGYLHGNSLISFKGRGIYDFKYPETKREELKGIPNFLIPPITRF